MIIAIAAFVIGAALAGAAAYWFARASRRAVEQEAARLQEAAQRDADAIRRQAEIEAKEAALKARAEAEREARERRAEVDRETQRVREREEGIDRQLADFDRKGRELKNAEEQLKRREQTAEANALKAQESLAEARRRLEKLAGMTTDQARKELEGQVIEEARRAAATEVAKIEEETRREADERSKRIIAESIQRRASEYVHERTVTVVNLPSDDMKGRIIGREGRNIRALEAATGIDLVIDDTPEAVVISAFDPMRREIAKLTLTRLMADGRIHPARIEELADKAAAEIEKQCQEAAEQAAFDLGLHRVHPELLKLLGALKFRSSYAQNMLQHSVEVGYLAGVMAGELGQSIKLARRAGLLHDIGHAAPIEMEGSHAAIGAQLAKKYGESPRVAQAIAAHRGEVPAQDVLDHLVDAANRLSTERPGARREQVASHIQRMESMEKICRSFGGVERAYAILYGREVRVMVDNARINDQQAILLCRDIARKIEEELAFPGPVQVAVVRETRAVEYAK